MARTVTPLTDSKIRTTISNQKKEVNKKALKLKPQLHHHRLFYFRVQII